jgi:hypothetical protein
MKTVNLDLGKPKITRIIFVIQSVLFLQYSIFIKLGITRVVNRKIENASKLRFIALKLQSSDTSKIVMPNICL